MREIKPTETAQTLVEMAGIQAIEEAALAFLHVRKLAVTPENYAVAFHYFSPEGNPALKQGMERPLASKSAFSQEFCTSLHAKYLSSVYEMQALKTASETLQGELAAVISSLKTAGEETTDFGDRLGVYSNHLSGGGKAGSFKPLIDKLLAETRGMEQKSRALEGRLQSSSDEINNLKKNLQLVRAEALTDQLTQIGNRKYLEESFQEICASRPPVSAITLMMGDIDNFKAFNDNWGHQMGDQVLKIVAQCIKRQLQGRGSLARYGGEEFVVILPNMSLAGSVALAEEIRKSICKQKMKKKASGESIGQVTISFGVAMYRAGETLNDLQHRADEALYEAKRGGRNRVVAETLSGEQKQVG
jgi:diguanylate cyclase